MQFIWSNEILCLLNNFGIEILKVNRIVSR